MFGRKKREEYHQWKSERYEDDRYEIDDYDDDYEDYEDYEEYENTYESVSEPATYSRQENSLLDEIEALEKEKQLLSESSAHLKNALNEKQKENDQLAVKISQLHETQERFSEMQRRYEAIQEKNKELNQEVLKLQTELAKTESSLSQEIELLTDQKHQLEKQTIDKNEIAEVLMEAKAQSRQMVTQGKYEAERIRAEAKADGERLRAEGKIEFKLIQQEVENYQERLKQWRQESSYLMDGLVEKAQNILRKEE